MTNLACVCNEANTTSPWHRPTRRQTNRHADRQARRQADRQTGRHSLPQSGDPVRQKPGCGPVWPAAGWRLWRAQRSEDGPDREVRDHRRAICPVLAQLEMEQWTCCLRVCPESEVKPSRSPWRCLSGREREPSEMDVIVLKALSLILITLGLKRANLHRALSPPVWVWLHQVWLGSCILLDLTVDFHRLCLSNTGSFTVLHEIV